MEAGRAGLSEWVDPGQCHLICSGGPHMQALIQVGVYHRSVVEGLINAQVTEPTDFEWQRQLRYYWDRDLSTCLVNIADTSARYGFEYQACTPAVVPHTALNTSSLADHHATQVYLRPWQLIWAQTRASTQHSTEQLPVTLSRLHSTCAQSHCPFFALENVAVAEW